jgi:L-fuconolactonase
VSANNESELPVIVDAQLHIWAANSPQRPWPAPPPGQESVKPHCDIPYTAERVLQEMDRAGVDRAVIVPPSWEGDRNDLALAAASAYPDRFAVMGRIDFAAPDLERQIETWRKQQGMLGLRFTFQTDLLEQPLRAGLVDKAWAAAERAGVPIMIVLRPHLLEVIDRVAERYPNLRLVVDHLALLTRKKDDEAFSRLNSLLPLAKRPNVAVKATCLPSYTVDAYPYHRLRPYLKKVFDAFGARRVFWGSDLSRLPCTYRQAVTMITEETDWLSREDKEWVMGRGVCEWLGWK